MASRHGKCPPRVILRRSLAVFVTCPYHFSQINLRERQTRARAYQFGYDVTTLNERVHGIKARDEVSFNEAPEYDIYVCMLNLESVEKLDLLIYLNIFSE